MKKRKLICCTMLVLLCLSLAACSEKAENTAPAGSPEPETIREEKPDTSSTGIFDE